MATHLATRPLGPGVDGVSEEVRPLPRSVPGVPSELPSAKMGWGLPMQTHVRDRPLVHDLDNQPPGAIRIRSDDLAVGRLHASSAFGLDGYNNARAATHC